MAAITLNMLSGQNGVLKKVGEASETQSHAQIKEAMSLLYNEYVIDEQTGQSTDTFIKYVQAKGKIDNDGIIDTKKLAGGKTALGNGTQNNDVYKLEKIKNGYAIYYYGKSEDEEIKAIWQTDGSTLSATKNIKLTASADVLYDPDNSQTYLDIFVNYDIDTVSFEAKEEFLKDMGDEWYYNGETLTYQELIEEAFYYYYSLNSADKNIYLKYLLLKDNNLNGKTGDEIFSIYSIKSIPFEEKETVLWECAKLDFGNTYKNLEEVYNENNSENLTYNVWVNDVFWGIYYNDSDISSIIVNIVPIEEQEEYLDYYLIANTSILEQYGVSTLEEFYNYIVENESEQLEAEGITTYEEFVKYGFINLGSDYYEYKYKISEYSDEEFEQDLNADFEKLKNALKVEIEYPNGEKKIWNYVDGYRFYKNKLKISFNYGCAGGLITDYGIYKINVISESLGINYYTEYEYKNQKYMRVIDSYGNHELQFYDIEQNKSITYEDISKITAINQGTGEEYEVVGDDVYYFYRGFYRNCIAKNGTKFVIELKNGEVAEFIMTHYRYYIVPQ